MAELDQETITRLISCARSFRERAYAPYSGFKVGAALLTENGTIYGGCNVENASYGLTICAERTAIASAVAAGDRKFRAIAIVTADAAKCSPCGACRQFMVEFSPHMTVILAGENGTHRVFEAKDLLPEFFSMPD